MIFCTLFNSYYLTRGLALYHSLKNTCTNFTLYVFAFDNQTYEYLTNASLPGLIPVSLQQFEDAELLKVKPTRSFAEYCWTSTSSAILWVLNNTDAAACTYLDADLFFFHSPQLLLSELQENDSVLITSHNYTPRYDQSALSGKYCVQFMHFKKNVDGLTALNWWREQCLAWCYNRHEDGKFGDQKYLDDWPQRFKGICELEHKGWLAPWNVQQYNLINSDINQIEYRPDSKKYPCVFFHFHGVKYYDNGKFILAPQSYLLKSWVVQHFYQPYGKLLLQMQDSLSFDGMGTLGKKMYFKEKFLKGHLASFKRNIINRFFV